MVDADVGIWDFITQPIETWPIQIFQLQETHIDDFQVSIFDATNNTRERRKMVWERVEERGIR